MSEDKVQLEWLVSEVVRRLQQLAAARGTPPTPAPSPSAPESSPATAPPMATPAASGTTLVTTATPATSPAPTAVPAAGDLVLDTRLISLAVVAGRLAGVRRVLIPAGAVVTPSVRDVLRKERVALEVLPAREANCDGDDPLVLARWTRTARAAQAAEALVQAAGVPALAFESLTAATQTILRSLTGPSRRAVLLTDEPLLAVCLVNRAPVARAARVQDVVQLQEAINAISLNCLVIDPLLCSSAMWHQLLTIYRDGSSEASLPRELIAAEATGG